MEGLNGQFESLTAQCPCDSVVYNGHGVVASNNTASLHLLCHGCRPGAVDVLLRELSQLREVKSDVLSTGVYKLGVLDWVVLRHWAIDEGTAAGLHPVAAADTCLKVKQVLLKGLQSMDPGHPEVSSGQEGCHYLPGGVNGGQRTLGKL